MPGNTSFNYAIFKRLQGAYVAGIGTATGFHMDPANPMGGFCLLYPDHPNGILGKIANNNAMGLAGLAPLAPTPTPADSPLFDMLSAGLGAPDTIPNNVAVGGQMWPIMPPPEQVDPPPALGTQLDQLWLGFNTGSPPPLLNAFGQWIGNGKPDDSPQNGPLAQPGLSSLQPPASPAPRRRSCSPRASPTTTGGGTATAARRSSSSATCRRTSGRRRRSSSTTRRASPRRRRSSTPARNSTCAR